MKMLTPEDPYRGLPLDWTSRDDFRPHPPSIYCAVTNAVLTRAKQAQACNTAPCLRISDIFT